MAVIKQLTYGGSTIKSLRMVVAGSVDATAEPAQPHGSAGGGQPAPAG